VSGNGAYEGEMNEVALFQSALRAAVPTRPSQALGTTLVPRLAEVARAATIEAETTATRRTTAAPRSRFALVARVAVVVALIPLVLAGLAFAGVTVPGPARDAFDSVGITLPNQPSSDNAATNSQKKSSGEATGNDVSNSPKPVPGSKGRSQAAHKHALAQHNKAHGKALGHEKGKAIGLNGSTPPGQAKEPGPPSQSNAGGNAGGNSATHTTTHAVPQHTTPTTPGNGKGHAK
jgi:hypothetical protein